MSSSNGISHFTRPRVVITGMGTVNPIGSDVPSTWQAALAGANGVAPITHFDTSPLDFKIAGEVKNFDPTAHFGPKEARRLDRVSQLALVAAREAFADSQLVITDEAAWDVGLIIGCAIGGINTLTSDHEVMMKKGPRRISPFTVPMMLPDTATGQLAMHFKIRGPNYCLVTACASSTNAIGEAFEMIRAGRANAVLTGGTEAAINPFALSAFRNMGALCEKEDVPETASRPFDLTRNGFVTGEGATMLVLESLGHAQARGAKIHAEVIGYGCTDDAFHITAPDVNGPAMSMKLALKQAGLQPTDIDYLNAHGTSTPLNDANETKAIKKIWGEAAYDLTISSTKSMTGHLFGAAGALEAMFCVKAIHDDAIPPPLTTPRPTPTALSMSPPTTARPPAAAS
ncbi:MAG: beta-ketoacyl-ACP synthase II [Anaerolineae bacterium]|nr:beta-ketoacyl-ACP synthase II [Anaerolineae bacterium]